MTPNSQVNLNVYHMNGFWWPNLPKHILLGRSEIPLIRRGEADQVASSDTLELTG